MILNAKILIHLSCEYYARRYQFMFYHSNNKSHSVPTQAGRLLCLVLVYITEQLHQYLFYTLIKHIKILVITLSVPLLLVTVPWLSYSHQCAVTCLQYSTEQAILLLRTVSAIPHNSKMFLETSVSF